MSAQVKPWKIEVQESPPNAIFVPVRITGAMTVGAVAALRGSHPGNITLLDPVGIAKLQSILQTTEPDINELAAANAKIAQLQSILRERDTTWERKV